MSASAIGAVLDLKPSYVRQIIALYRVSDHEHREWVRSAKRANAAFLAAIAATGMSFG